MRKPAITHEDREIIELNAGKLSTRKIGKLINKSGSCVIDELRRGCTAQGYPHDYTVKRAEEKLIEEILYPKK